MATVQDLGLAPSPWNPHLGVGRVLDSSGFRTGRLGIDYLGLRLKPRPSTRRARHVWGMMSVGAM